MWLMREVVELIDNERKVLDVVVCLSLDRRDGVEMAGSERELNNLLTGPLLK
jgi:hypothetical protein